MKKRYIKPFAGTTKVAFVHVIAASDPDQAGNHIGTGWNTKGSDSWEPEEDNTSDW